MLDLRKDLTVFVLTVGEYSTGDCLARLDAQDVRFTRNMIDHVAPMYRAFQSMLERCRTPYFVQVDADMLLQPWAVRRLYETLVAASPDVAFVSAWLWDLDVRRPIHGVKAYRHEICARFPYRESQSCEVDQIDRMRGEGFRWAPVDTREEVPEAECFGLHYPSQTPEMAFRRWKRLFEKHRIADNLGWIAPWADKLLEEWRANPTEIAKWKMLGAIAGLTGPRPPETELDFRLPDQDFRRLGAYVGEEAKGPTEISLYLTDRCNFRCEFDGIPCMRETEEVPGAGVPHNGDMELWRLRDTLDRFPTIRGCCIAGFGEPLLHPQLGELIDLLHERNVYVGVITNGSLLASNAEQLEGRASKIGYLSVSLNAIDAEGHREMSKTKTWEKVLAGIRRLAGGTINVGLSFVVGKPGVDEIPRAIALSNELGVRFVHFHNPLPHAGTDLRFRSTVITDRDVEVLAKIEGFNALPGAEVVKGWPTPISFEAGANPLKCRSPFVSLGVDASGAISGCRRVTPPSIDQGGIYWPDLWRTPSLLAARLELTGDRPLPEKCTGCFGNWKE